MLLALMVTVNVTMSVRADDRPAAKKPPAGKANMQPSRTLHVAVTISKETTYITGPLRKEGYVDYVAATNERYGHGVTRENNASVLFWKAMGPGKIPNANRERFFKMLGIPPLPEQGDCFVDFSSYVQRLQDAGTLAPAEPGKESVADAYEQFDRAMKQPWSKTECPVVVGWLAANEKHMATLVEATGRPRCYQPLLSTDTIAAIGEDLPAIQQYREFARVFVARAMLRLGEGNVDDAWRDLLACHRLARLVGQRPLLIHALVAIAVDGIACSGDQALLQHARLTATQALKMREDLAKLAPVCRMADTFDFGERFVCLDCVSLAARNGVSALAGMLGLHSGKLAESLMNQAARAAIDWDEILRMSNSWYDRIADAYRKPAGGARNAAIRKLDEEIHKQAQVARDVKSLALSVLATPRQAISERVGKVFLAEFLSAAIGPVSVAENRAAVRIELDKVAVALAAYRADHDSYPAKLADLVPKYLAQLPKDIFNDADLHYRLEAGGYVLYSVGPNRKDDGAKSYEDRTETNDEWDDLVVRVKDAARR
jgi:hypothetical protein